jgi:hypothetical protein
MPTRILAALLLASLVTATASAADLEVRVVRNGFAGPIDVAVAPRVEGSEPRWSTTKTLPAGQAAVTFSGLGPGLYVVLASGPEPLQRLSAKANVGSEGGALRLVVPKTKTVLRARLAGRPLARAKIVLTHDELRWITEVRTGEDGRFQGALWEPGLYTATVTPDRAAAPYYVDVMVTPAPLTIDVPDRQVAGRVTDDDGKPVAGALVLLRSQAGKSTLTVRGNSGPDGTFEFFGVPEGSQTLSARAPSYLNSDDAVFELRGPTAHHSEDLRLARGTQRIVRVLNERGAPIANATLLAACDGQLKSTSVTDMDGSANVALAAAGACAIYALPKEGSLAMVRVEGPERLVIRVPDGSSSLRLALKSEAGVAFSDLWLLMRVDGMVVPPAIAHKLIARGFSLITNAEGSISLSHIPPGTYEFWPYRSEVEGQMIYDVSSGFAAPISLNVVTGENNATVRFKARR